MATRKTTKTTRAAAADAGAAEVKVVAPIGGDASIRKPELVERVMAETGLKRKDVKPVVEGTLAVLGRALASGETLVAQPFGKVMVKKSKPTEGATVYNVKVRQKN